VASRECEDKIIYLSNNIYTRQEQKMLTLPSLEEIKTAANRLKKITVHTPLVQTTQKELYLKPETLQPVKSFKIRGVYNAVATLSQEQRKKGLSTMSSGNTAIALGWVAKHFNVPAKTVVPDTTPANKIQKMKSYGVDVITKSLEDIFIWHSKKGWEQDSANFIHPWHNRDLHAGHGTIGLEIFEDLPEIETVYVPVGGGGLITGVGNSLKLLKPGVRVVGVESEACPNLSESFKAGKGVTVSVGDTVCEGTAAPLITEEMYPILKELVDESVTVSEKAVKKSMKDIMLTHKLIVEGSGALAYTAAMQDEHVDRGKSVCLVTGGTVDARKIVSILTDPEL
jgi:threonine dehydratase